jgi:pimeloyl-ACP methyl ester carboxylesterase
MSLTIDGAHLESRWWRTPGADVPPLVLLHEGLGCVSSWRDFPGVLAARTGRDVFAYSRRGYGQSAARAEPLPLDFMEIEGTRVVPRVLDAIGVDRAALVGHSDGGSIALLAAATWPARVEALVLLAAHVFVEDVTVASIATMRERYRSTTELRARLSRHHAHVDEMFGGWSDVWLDPRFKTWNIEEWLARVKAPALVLQGTNDAYGTPLQVDAIARGLAGPVTTALIQNCGHALQRDQPVAILHHIARFLAAIPG